MKVNIQSIHFDADIKLINFIEEKMTKLNTFYDGIIGNEVFLRLDKSSDAENKIVEVKINIPGNDLFAKKQSKSFEEATDLAMEALKTQLIRHKEKQN